MKTIFTNTVTSRPVAIIKVCGVTVGIMRSVRIQEMSEVVYEGQKRQRKRQKRISKR